MFGAIRKLVKVQCRERRIVSIFGAAWCACRQKAKKAGGQRTDPKAKYGNRMRRWRQPRPGRGRVRVLTPPRFLHRLSIFALTLYALLPIIQNTYVGIAGVDPPVREAAVAMGLTPRQLLWHVELPLASNVIVAGIRVATVATVGLATIAAAIGAGGLGEYIFRGLAMVDNRVILAGAVPAALMALTAYLLLGLLQRMLVRVRVHH